MVKKRLRAEPSPFRPRIRMMKEIRAKISLFDPPRRARRGEPADCLRWLLPECAEVKISQQPYLGKHALLSLASLLTSQLDLKDRVHDNLSQTRVSGCEEGRRGATSISGPDDPKGMRCGADGRSDTRRPDRSHGPRSSSGFSRGGGKSQ
jgi:hypothetical protein